MQAGVGGFERISIPIPLSVFLHLDVNRINGFYPVQGSHWIVAVFWCNFLHNHMERGQVQQPEYLEGVQRYFSAIAFVRDQKNSFPKHSLLLPYI